MPSTLVPTDRIESRRPRRKRLLISVVFAVVATVGFACGSGDDVGAMPSATVPTAPPTETPELTVQPSATPTVGLSEEESQARIVYRGNASKAIDIIGRTAQLVSGIGLGVSRAGDGPVEARSVAEAAIGSFDLARSVLEQEPVPEGLDELHTAILDSIRFYSEAAQTLINTSEAGEFDFFVFQEPFQKGGENFHEAGRLLGEARR